MSPAFSESFMKSLPEGVVPVSFGVPGDDDFEIVSQVVDGKPVPIIFKGVRPGAAAAVIVKPAEGYAFRANIRTLGYDVVKVFPEPLKITATATFTVTNSYDKESVDQALEKLKALPGFMELKEEA